MASKRAIVTGASGQDGFYMSKLLESKGYTVHTIHACTVSDYIDYYMPDEVYNFAGVSNVINPFLDVAEIMEVNLGTVARILTAIQTHCPETKFFQASSCLALEPTYPYGISKRAADELIKQYRDKFGLYACSGIMYPHESPRRKDYFFSKKIIKAALNKEKVTVGNLNVYRDYGYAPDYMEAAWLMLQQERPKDYVIGTGVLTSLRDFTKLVFEEMDLNYKDYVVEDVTNARPEPIMQADISTIRRELGWYPKHDVNDLIKIMLHGETVIAG